MQNFTATIKGQTYTDPALFEVAAKEYRAERRATAPRGEKEGWDAVRGENSALVRAASGKWKMPARKAWTERTGFEVGAEVKVFFSDYDQNPVSGQVWSLAPKGGVWVVMVGGGAVWLDPKTGDTSAPLYGTPLNYRVRPREAGRV